MELKNNNRKSDSVQQESIVGLSFIVRIVHSTANTAFSVAASLFDWTKLNISCVLERNGKEFDVINNAPMKPILKALSLQNELFANIIYDTKNLVDTVISQAAGVDHEMILSFDLLFDSGIILKGDDKFTTTAKINSGFFVNVNISTAESTVNIDPVFGVTKEYGVPHIRVDSIQESANDFDTPVRDNVTSMYFVNMSDASYTENNRILDSVSIRSDELNDTKSFERLVGEKNGYLPANNSYQRDQSFKILDGQLTSFDSTKVKFSLEETNVSVGDNYVVTMYSVIDPETYERQVKRDRKQVAEKSIVIEES